MPAERSVGITSSERFTLKARKQKRYYRMTITEKLAYAALVYLNVRFLRFHEKLAARDDITIHILTVIPRGYKIAATIDVLSGKPTDCARVLRVSLDVAFDDLSGMALTVTYNFYHY